MGCDFSREYDSGKASIYRSWPHGRILRVGKGEELKQALDGAGEALLRGVLLPRNPRRSMVSVEQLKKNLLFKMTMPITETGLSSSFNVLAGEDFREI